MRTLTRQAAAESVSATKVRGRVSGWSQKLTSRAQCVFFDWQGAAREATVDRTVDDTSLVAVQYDLGVLAVGGIVALGEDPSGAWHRLRASPVAAWLEAGPIAVIDG